MKILINRISNRISGAEIYNLYFLKSLKQFNDLDIVFSSDNRELNERVEKLGVKVKSIYPGVNEIGTKKQFIYTLIRLPSYFWRYLQFFSQINFNIVIFESLTEKIFLTILLRILGKKVVWIEHGALFNTQKASVVKWLFKLNSKFVSKIICVSQSTKDDLLENGISEKKTTVIYVGIDENEFAPLNQNEIFRLKSKLGLSKKDIVGFLGEVTRIKGIVDFLETATLLLKERSDIQFFVIGSGDMLDWLKLEVERRKISGKFLFTGFIKNVKEYLGIMDILFFPSYHQEGLSISLLEATSMGIPIVATNRGGNNEIVLNQVNGFLYKNSSAKKNRDLLLDALSRKKQLKLNTRKVISDKFSNKESGRRFYNLFKSI